jgi:nucleosome binding factor SPN SPT16 subunit
MFIGQDPEKFIEDGGWEFLNMEASDSDSEKSEESDEGYEPSDVEVVSESEDDDSDDESVVESEDDEVRFFVVSWKAQDLSFHSKAYFSFQLDSRLIND